MKNIQAKKIFDVNTDLYKQISAEVKKLSKGKITEYQNLLYESNFWQALILEETGTNVSFTNATDINKAVEEVTMDILKDVTQAVNKAVVQAKSKLKDITE